MNTLLDVPTIIPRSKHPFIFQNFDQLLHGHGAILTLVNDQDPISLYYQFDTERAWRFCLGVQYIARGLEKWKVKLTKLACNRETVGEVVRKNPKAAAVFKKYNTDYYFLQEFMNLIPRFACPKVK